MSFVRVCWTNRKDTPPLLLLCWMKASSSSVVDYSADDDKRTLITAHDATIPSCRALSPTTTKLCEMRRCWSIPFLSSVLGKVDRRCFIIIWTRATPKKTCLFSFPWSGPLPCATLYSTSSVGRSVLVIQFDSAPFFHPLTTIASSIARRSSLFYGHNHNESDTFVVGRIIVL